jgi:hypothetical protein
MIRPYVTGYWMRKGVALRSGMRPRWGMGK